MLSIRTFFPGRPMVVDDEAFEKLSIEIPAGHPGVPIDLGSGVRFYYSKGASAWSPTAGDVFAMHAQGTVTVLRVDDAHGVLDARLDLACQPVIADCRKPGAPPEVKRISGDFAFVRKSFDDLSPWLGGSGSRLRNFP